jgi:nucleotide-binding universal stress UspA family protein
VHAVTRLARGRSAAAEIVEEARRRDADIVVVGAPRQKLASGRALFGLTVDRVLKQAPCRVLVAAGTTAV